MLRPRSKTFTLVTAQATPPWFIWEPCYTCSHIYFTIPPHLFFWRVKALISSETCKDESKREFHTIATSDSDCLLIFSFERHMRSISRGSFYVEHLSWPQMWYLRLQHTKSKVHWHHIRKFRTSAAYTTTLQTNVIKCHRHWSRSRRLYTDHS